MIILAVSRGNHDASVALLKDEEVLFHIHAERLSNIKYDSLPFQAISKIKDYVDHIDFLVLTGLEKTTKYDVNKTIDAYTAHVMGLNKTFYDHKFEVIDLWDKHHEVHAATAFYNSGFDSALCVVKDGFGSDFYFNNNVYSKGTYGIEIGSSFIMSYPSNIELVRKHIQFNNKNTKQIKEYIHEKIFLSNSISEAAAFERTAKAFGFRSFDAGKIMGMSAYGKPDNKFSDELILKNGLVNAETFPYLDNDSQDNYKLNVNIENNFESQANFAYKLQNETQNFVKEEVLELLNTTQEKNLCLSGGFFLNCVSNYNLLKNLPKDINIYVEPMCNDAGNSLGAAKYFYHFLTKDNTKRPQKNIYYGPSYSYTKNDILNEKIIENVTSYQVAKLISEKNIIAMYQGRSEQGPRALGNRSILYDPRDPEGKDHVNTIKKREWFRPFAGSVLKEEAKKWFDLKSLDESKFMMFAVDVLKDKQSLIPAITHVDGTCRIQTVSKEDNENFYNLIKEFYSITGVPILFNTSFNLAGDVIVETLHDALKTLKNSKINYLYLPEMSILIKNPNDTIDK